MDIVLLGLNHKTAPVELRECLAFSGDDSDRILKHLKNHMVYETMILSTCNRVEILLIAKEAKPVVDSLKKYIAESRGIAGNDLEASLYIHLNDDAVRHLFRVASGLDSMVMGEPQILGQIKEAYRQSVDKKTSGVILNRLLHRTFFVAKKVRTETGVGDRAVSISYAAIELARKIFGILSDKKALLIGAGEMAELAVEHLLRQRIQSIFVANRTFERGLELAGRFGGEAIAFNEIPQCLTDVDIVISSTGAPGFILEKADVKKVMKPRKNRPIFFIDIAVPRDIDPEINKLNNIYVYDIDDLKDVIDENMEERNREAVKAGRLIDEAVIRFNEWLNELDVVPTIKSLKQKMEDIVYAELEKSMPGLMKNSDDADNDAMKKLADAIVKKMIHFPIMFLKGNGFHGDKMLYVDAVRKLFNLDMEKIKNEKTERPNSKTNFS